ncbi:MFS transporter [Belnapia sp. T18]|uniref:MFS transporter n=1 Tax=Belnapia arida TaxID=2804533 RepID=A0ABS1UBT4_9PROT|nr:MFS transporter [Belnapia arida]MBL6081975.1 MFS transporter [Belnapia arida]
MRRAVARSTPRRTPSSHAWRRPAPPPLLFRGWLVVAGAFLVLMAGYGAAYSYAAFAAELEEAFGASRASVSMVYAICGCAAFAVSAVSGPLADRIGPRPLAAAGMGLVAIGLLAAAAARTLLEIYFCYGLVIGLGIGFAYVPAMAAVQRWFVAWRGLASGMAAAGIGVGTALVPPAAWAAAALDGWRMAFVAAGIAVAVVGIGGALLLAESPERYGERCDGDAAAPALPTAEGPGLAEALRCRSFWLYYAGTLLVSMPISLPFAHLAQSATDVGMPRTEALALLSLLGIGSIIGRFALGAVADEIGREATFLGCSTAVVGLTALWALADSHLLLVAFAVGFGAAYGGFVALLPAVTADRFGRRGVGGVIGVLFTGRGIALLVAAPALALLTGWTGGYALPLGMMALVGGVGVALLAIVPRSS